MELMPRKALLADGSRHRLMALAAALKSNDDLRGAILNAGPAGAVFFAQQDLGVTCCDPTQYGKICISRFFFELKSIEQFNLRKTKGTLSIIHFIKSDFYRETEGLDGESLVQDPREWAGSELQAKRQQWIQEGLREAKVPSVLDAVSGCDRMDSPV